MDDDDRRPDDDGADDHRHDESMHRDDLHAWLSLVTCCRLTRAPLSLNRAEGERVMAWHELIGFGTCNYTFVDRQFTCFSSAVNLWFCSISSCNSRPFSNSVWRNDPCCSINWWRTCSRSVCSSSTRDSYSPSSVSSLRRSACFSCSRICQFEKEVMK